MRAPVTWRVPPKSYVNVSDVRWVPGRQFDHPLSVVTPLRVRSTGYPASVTVPGTPQLSAPGRSHVTTTGVPAPHGYCGTTVDGNVGATPTAVATCTGDTDCNAVLRNVHLWWAPVLLAHVPTVVPGAVPSPATSSCSVVATFSSEYVAPSVELRIHCWPCVAAAVARSDSTRTVLWSGPAAR